MQKIIMMDMEEYNDLLKIQKEPDAILIETAANYKAKLDEAYKIIADQQKQLETFVIGGMKQKPSIDEIIAKPTTSKNQLDIVIKQSQFKNHPNNIVDIAKSCNVTKTLVLKTARAMNYIVTNDGIIKKRV